MTLQKLAGKRLLEGGAAVFMALLLAGPAVAAPDQSRQPHGSGGDGGRTAVPHSMGSGPSGPSARSADGGGGGGGGGRTAQPAPGGDGGGGGGNHPSRQPPHNPGGGGHGHGGYYGGGYYGGYYPYYYPYYGWWGWGGWWGAPYYYGGPGGYPYYPDGGGGYYDGDAPLGALDLDVSPGRTQVYLDGRYVGTVDAFDGFPRYLWLQRGTYDLAFYLDGFKTVSRQVSVYPGTVIDLDDRMEPGESVKPEDLPTKNHERRDTRIREEDQRREEVQGEEGDWHDRVRGERERRHEGDQGQDDERGRDQAGEDNGRGNETRHGQLHIDVDPEDASIYLDGRFVGTAEQLEHGLSVNPGKHQISVVRPGHESKELEIEVEAGQQVEVDIDLGATQ